MEASNQNRFLYTYMYMWACNQGANELGVGEGGGVFNLNVTLSLTRPVK